MHARPARSDARAARRPSGTDGRRPSARRAESRGARSAQRTGPGDGARILAAALSAVLPGLGQLANRQLRLAAIFALPVLAVLGLVWLIIELTSPSRFAASVIVPPALGLILVLNGVALLWRLAAVGQAFLDERYPSRPSGRGWLGLALVMAFVAAPHAYGSWVGAAAMQTFDRVFETPPGNAPAPTGPGATERLNVLLIGVDAAPDRTAILTDTLMVASVDPVGETVTMISVPRDLVGLPLPAGGTWEPKINSLYSYAENHPDEFPGGGEAALKDVIGALFGIEIHYHALVDMAGFVQMVDAVGGVDVNVARDLNDPKYDGFGVGERGWSITAGRHHLDGVNALAYARIRRSEGETDFTRAQRQQQILVAIRNAAVRGDTLLLRLPALLDAVGDTVRTDLPRDRLPMLAGLAQDIDDDRTVRIVIRDPLVAQARNEYGSVLIPDIPAIRAVAAGALGEPGVEPRPWPTPTPSPTLPSRAP